MKQIISLFYLLSLTSGFSANAQKTNSAVVITTCKGCKQTFNSSEAVVFAQKSQPLETEISVFVDPTKKFQNYIGIGGALTDAAAETFFQLTPEKQKELLSAYFDKNVGIGYTIARTNINSCDFSSDMYTYVKENDISLHSFNISHDLKYKIPFIKAAQNVAKSNFKLFASPWSPPSWMKTNNDMLHGGTLQKTHYQTWANYFSRFIKAYESEGIPVWGVSIQNEPMATQRWESCIYSANDEVEFLKNYLGPTLKKDGFGSKKIIGWDHNRDLLFQRASALLNDPKAAQYVWGIGFHWYEPWSGGDPMFENVKLVHDAFPDKQLLFTEGCAEKFDYARLNSWELGERYAFNMIHDFNNGMSGFTDWNILLDENGGPNHVGNFCFAPVHANLKTGELIFTNAYYYIGHFSKYIKPGAKKISVSSSRSQLLATGFVNPDGTVVVVVLNQTNNSIPYFVWVQNKAIKVEATARSIATILF